jgi:formylglycine-generating enzyme required for sulfatase activity
MAINRRQRPASATEMRKALRNAVEEDEQHAAEEEYRRAEESRKQRDEKQRRAADEAAHNAEEDRQRKEAETRELEEARRRKAEEREREEEAERHAEVQRRDEAERQKREAEEAERQRAGEEERRCAEQHKRVKEEEARRQANLLVTAPAQTVRSQEYSSNEPAKPPPSIETLKAPAPERVFSVGKDRVDDSSGVTTVGESLVENRGRNRTVMIVAVGLVAVGLVGVVLRGALNKNPTTESSRPTQGSQPAMQTEKPAPPTGMVYVPGGTFMMGRDNGVDEAERPAHQVNVKPFFIDTYEVTNEDFEKFVKATSHRTPATWKNGSFPLALTGAKRTPVTGVTWDDANDYAQWAAKRLPTEEEWEFAARGTDGRLYPWGSNWQPGSANANGVGIPLLEVGMSKGTSPFGAFDMVGNAWEWTASDFRAYPGGRLPADEPGGELKVIRGGSYESTKDYATTTYRTGWPARGAKTYDQTGFRCVKDVPR